jgi:hypothetical protein
MPQLKRSNRRTAALAVLLLLLAGLLLAACGGSSPSSTSTTKASASTTSPSSTTPSTGAPRGLGRFAHFRECLDKNGISLPKFTRGKRPSGGFLGGGAGPQLPAGVSRAKYEAALKKCGGAPGAGRARGFASNPKAKEALDKFAACMRADGIELPAPNTSGSGPVFDTKGIDVAGSKFTAAEAKCGSSLRGVFGAGLHPGGAPGGAPPAAG